MTYIERYMQRLGIYLEKQCFCKYPCTNEMIMKAIRARGVECSINNGDLVEVPVREWCIIIAEEMHAMGPGGIVYCPPI
ncbi:hypothetical protein H8E77_22100 [bacterium]|nr:hypothetical protein [bacterium]